MKALYLVLYIVAAVCFAIAALSERIGVTSRARPNLISVGLLAWVLVPLIEDVRSIDN